MNDKKQCCFKSKVHKKSTVDDDTYSAFFFCWWRISESNRLPFDCQSNALAK